MQPPEGPSAPGDPGDAIHLDLMRRTAVWRGRRIEVVGRAFDLLVALAARPGAVQSPDELMSRVWDGVVVEPGNLRVQINHLRRHLGEDTIATIKGRGYRFQGRATLVDRAPTAPPLFGRDAELAVLAGGARSSRLLSVTGGAGVGKTRLVRHWFDTSLRPSGGVARWIDLSQLHLKSALLPLISQTLGAEMPPALHASSLTQQLDALVRLAPPTEACLVLDNAEHLVPSLAPLLAQMLPRLAWLRVVVTSQRPMRLPEEQVLRLRPLDIPNADAPLEHARWVSSVALLVDRVQLVDPSFRLDADNVHDVCRLCRSLEGLPLALELAAAPMAAMGPKALLRSMQGSLPVLGDLRAPPAYRHRTLDDALAWSLGVLEPAARTVFARLGVFAGDFSHDDALEVVVDAAGAGDVPTIDRAAAGTALAALVDASLVSVSAGEPRRYRLLESPRRFALSTLERTEGTGASRARHLRWCVRWIEGATTDDVLRGQGQLRTALEWAMAGGDPATGAVLAQRLSEHPLLTPTAGVPAGAELLTGETLAALLQRLRDSGVIGGRQRDSIAHATVLSLARRLRQGEVRDFDAAVRELERAVRLARSALRQPPAQTQDTGSPAEEATVALALADVASLTADGHFDDATDRVDAALDDLKRQEKRRTEAMKAARLKLLEAGLQQDLLRRDPFAVARRVQAMVELDHPDDPTGSASWLGHEMRYIGEDLEKAGPLDLRVGIELLRRREARAKDPELRLAASVLLAEALNQLAWREADVPSMQDAARVCEAALATLERQADPRAWATLQHHWGGALQLLGEQTGDITKLEQALSCCEAALSVRNRAEMPQAWAATQHLLGNTLRVIGMMESGSERLHASAHALREALQERTRGRHPVERASTLNTLGITLSVLATREGTLARRMEAIETSRAAAALLTAQEQPRLWGRLQNNIGIDLQLMDTSFDRPEALREALVAFRKALTVCSRQSAPGLWLRVMHNLASTQSQLGGKLHDAALLAEAAAGYREILAEQRRDRWPLAWAAGKNELGKALWRWGCLTPEPQGSAAIREAIELLEDSLSVRSREEMPLDWAMTQADLGSMHASLARIGGDPAQARVAEAFFERALQVQHRESHADWGRTRASLDELQQWLREQAPAQG